MKSRAQDRRKGARPLVSNRPKLTCAKPHDQLLATTLCKIDVALKTEKNFAGARQKHRIMNVPN